MSNRYKGGIISATSPTTSSSTASGNWTITQQMQAKAASNWPEPIVPVGPGQQEYTTPGTYTWIAPAGVSFVSVVCVGGGAGGYSGSTEARKGGGGGGLGYKNNIPVISGQSYTVFVGDAGKSSRGVYNGQDSYFIDTSTVKGGGGSWQTSGSTQAGGTYVGDGGGNGGYGWMPSANGSGGGGAGGYSGTGGNGATGEVSGSSGNGGGGGGGAGGRYEYPNNVVNPLSGGGGGGVGLLGQGSSGSGGITNSGRAGQGGSGGTSGSDYQNVRNGQTGGYYGGGAGGAQGDTSSTQGPGGSGAVRIIWAGNRQGDVARAFPSTNTGNLS